MACGKAWKHPSVVVFLSVDGCNTAGLCAVATLIDLCGVAPLDAWNGIRAARPIFSEGHVALLNARYPGNNFSCDAAPAWYGPQAEGDAEDDPEIDDDEPAPPPKKRTHDDAAWGDHFAPANMYRHPTGLGGPGGFRTGKERAAERAAEEQAAREAAANAPSCSSKA